MHRAWRQLSTAARTQRSEQEPNRLPETRAAEHRTCGGLGRAGLVDAASCLPRSTAAAAGCGSSSPRWGSPSRGLPGQRPGRRPRSAPPSPWLRPRGQQEVQQESGGGLLSRAPRTQLHAYGQGRLLRRQESWGYGKRGAGWRPACERSRGRARRAGPADTPGPAFPGPARTRLPRLLSWQHFPKPQEEPDLCFSSTRRLRPVRWSQVKFIRAGAPDPPI